MPEEVEPYKPIEVHVMDTSYVEQEAMEVTDACLFKGTFYDKQNKKVGVVLPPENFFKLHKAKECQEVFRKVGLDGYFNLPPWGVDIQRSYELMTTIDKDGNAVLTGKDGEELTINITEETVCDALKLPPPNIAMKLPHHLTEQERKETFGTEPGKHETFKDLLDRKVALPLRLYSQHFSMGKPQKYTQPNKRVTTFLTKAAKHNMEQKGDFNKSILQDIISYKHSKDITTNPHLANGLMLTRIAYQALGMYEDLPPPLSQEETASRVKPISPLPISMIIPPREKKPQRVLFAEGEPKGKEKTPEDTAFEEEAEEESNPPLTEEHKRFQKAHATYKAFKKTKKSTGPVLPTQQKGKGKLPIPERRSKQREDRPFRDAQAERMEMMGEQDRLEKQGQSLAQEGLLQQEQQGMKKRKAQYYEEHLDQVTKQIKRMAAEVDYHPVKPEPSGLEKELHDILDEPHDWAPKKMTATEDLISPLSS